MRFKPVCCLLFLTVVGLLAAFAEHDGGDENPGSWEWFSSYEWKECSRRCFDPETGQLQEIHFHVQECTNFSLISDCWESECSDYNCYDLY